METTIAVEGLAQFSRSLRKLDSEAPKQLRLVLNQAGDVVVQHARSTMPRRTGAAVGTVKARSTRTTVRVSEGSKRVPYVPWLDFGGKIGRRKSVRRPFFKEGRYLYPVLRKGALREKIIAILDDGLIEVVKASGLGVD